MKKIKLSKADILSALLCALTMIPCLGVYNRLPDRIATNFDLSGKPQQYFSKEFMVFVFPLIMAVIQLILCAITNLFHQKDTRDALNKAIRFLTPSVFYVAEFSIMLYALDQNKNIFAIICTLLGIILVIKGNFLPKIRRNMFLGIRTPHTLANQEVWDKTHRFTGAVSTICGILIIPFSFVNNYIVVVFIYLQAIILPFIYSEMIYRAKKQELQE